MAQKLGSPYRELLSPGARGARCGSWLWLFGVLMLLLLALGSFTMVRLGRIFENVRESVKVTEPRLAAARQMEIEMLAFTMNVRAYLDGYEDGRRLASENATDLVRYAAEYERLAETSRQLASVDRFALRWQELRAHGEKLIAAAQATSAELARLAALEIALERLIEEEILPDARQYQDAQTIAALSKLEATNRVALVQFSVGVGIVLTASAAVVWIVIGSQEALRLSEQRYRIVAEFNNDWEFWIAPEGTYAYASPSVERVTGRAVSPGMRAGDFLRAIVHPDDLHRHLEHLSGELSQQEAGELDFRVLHSDGSIRWIHHICQPMHDAAGLFLGTRGSNRDVTDRKRLELQLEESLHALREAQQELLRRERLAMLGKLAGSVAHHMRSPLAVIQNSIYFLEHSPQPPAETMREVLDEMKRAVSSSDHIITAMLDYVRDPADHSDVFPIGEAIARALQLVPVPETIHLQASNGEMERIEVRANREQVIRILVNLLENAVEAMPQGGDLEVAAFRVGADKVSIEVRDTGCGIPGENLSKIFDPLFSTRVKGIGLGLATAQRYARLNGGELLVESEVNSGSTFRLVIPSAT